MELTWLYMGISEIRGTIILGSLQYGSYYLGYYIRVPYLQKPPYWPYGGFIPLSMGFTWGLHGVCVCTTKP